MLSLSDFETWQQNKKKHFEDYFSFKLPHNDIQPSELHSAIRYAALGGGKRIRPNLISACGEDLHIHDSELLDQLAIAVEAIHVYSLIHDDLPSMDDDDLRRGKPACHVAYDEGVAVLAGDALQAWAFEMLTMLDIDNNYIVALIKLISQAIGPSGMAQGQSLDLCYEKIDITDKALSQMHIKKTGLLIEASVLMPLIATGNEQFYEPLKTFGHHLGLAFQIHDDILDIITPESKLGKPSNSDVGNNKQTFPAILGLEASIQHRDYQLEQALSALKSVNLHTGYLAAIAYYCIHRDH